MVKNLGLRFRALPPQVWAMAMIYGVGGTMCWFASVFPLSDEAPIVLARALGSGCLLVSLLILWRGRRLSSLTLQIAALGGTLANAVLVSSCATNYGAALNSFAWLWIGIYVGQFFEQRAVRIQCAAIVIASGVALHLSGQQGMVTAWAMIAGSSVLASEAVARVNSRLRRQLTTDPLTGLLNRTGLAAASERVRSLAARDGKPVSIALIDLDDFKRVNDLRGHAAGDELLSELGRAWGAELRGSDVLARFGGDEFALVMAGTEPADADSVLERLRAAAAAEWSAGVVEWKSGETLDLALARADAELYRTKRGRSGCEDVVPWRPPATKANHPAVA